jgi:hypothetical protein
MGNPGIIAKQDVTDHILFSSDRLGMVIGGQVMSTVAVLRIIKSESRGPRASLRITIITRRANAWVACMTFSMGIRLKDLTARLTSGGQIRIAGLPDSKLELP